MEELSLVCEELQPDVFVLSEHRFKATFILSFRIGNCALAYSFQRNIHKKGGVAIFIKNKNNVNAFR